MTKDDKNALVVLACSFCALTISLGIPLSFSIFLTVLLDYFKDTNGKAEVVAVGSIAYAILNLSSLVASWIYRRYGCRTVVISGSLLGTFGLFCSCFITRLQWLYLTYGIFGGLGFGFIYAPSLAILPEYFDKYKYFATSFATVGSALGTLIMPQIFLHLISAYTWRGAMLILAGIMLQIFIFGMFMKNCPTSAVVHSSTLQSTVSQHQLFKDVRFYMLCLDALCFGGCSFTMFSMISAFIVDRGLTLSLSATLVSIIGFSNIGGRLISSLISQFSCTNRRVLFTTVTAVCTLSSYCLVLCNDFWQFSICLAVFGASYGSRISQVSALLIDTFGVQHMANVIGYYFFAGGVGAFVIPPIAGFVADASTLMNAIVFAASVNFFDTLLCAVVVLLTCTKSKLKEKDAIGDNEL